MLIQTPGNHPDGIQHSEKGEILKSRNVNSDAGELPRRHTTFRTRENFEIKKCEFRRQGIIQTAHNIQNTGKF
jgi:hypothetical protein